jgi:hypothetical protein
MYVQQKSVAAAPWASMPEVPIALHVMFEKSVSGLSEPVHEKPYEGLPAESGWHPDTVESCSQVLVALTVVTFVKQQYSSTPFAVVGTLQTSVLSVASGAESPVAQL